MVLNFFQLTNYTRFTFSILNSGNSGDNYTVGPMVTTARHDAWLPMGNGSKGVSILASYPGASLYTLLYMWDQDWAVRYRIGGIDYKIDVNGNKDFWIEVYDEFLIFRCHNGSFTDDKSVVTVSEWQDRITNRFEVEARDMRDVEYAELFGDPDHIQKRSAGIKKATDRQKQQITELVAEWNEDNVDAHRGQGTIVTLNGWRIDLQDNGSVQRIVRQPDGSLLTMHFYNVAVQYGSDVYAHIMLPVGYLIGRRRIRNALLQSMNNLEVTIITPPPNASLPTYTTHEARTSWTVRSLAWLLLIGISNVRK